MNHSGVLLAGFATFALVIFMLVRRGKLGVRFAAAWVVLGLVGLLAAIIVPRTSFINDTLGITPTGALLALFSLATLSLLLMLAVALHELRSTSSLLLSELAIHRAELEHLRSQNHHGDDL